LRSAIFSTRWKSADKKIFTAETAEKKLLFKRQKAIKEKDDELVVFMILAILFSAGSALSAVKWPCIGM
jgi:hypothetical protein